MAEKQGKQIKNSKPGKKSSSSSSSGKAAKPLPDIQFESVFFDVPIEECKERARARGNHATLSLENVDTVIDEFARGLKAPEPWEGYSKVTRVTTNEESNALVKTYRAYMIDTSK
jgi:thymidylate kinase